MTGHEKSVSVIWSKVKMYASRLFHYLSALVALPGVSPPVCMWKGLFLLVVVIQEKNCFQQRSQCLALLFERGYKLAQLVCFQSAVLQVVPHCWSFSLLNDSLTLCALDFNCSFSAGVALKTFHTSICIEGHVLDQITLEKQSIDVYRVRAKLLQTASITAAPAAVVAMVWHVHLYIRMSEI